MSPFLQTTLGAAVSVVLFLIGYRQTVGARKERARAAATELQRTVLKRVLLEDYDPEPTDLARIIEAKAHEHSVRSTDLPSVTELLTDVQGRVLDDDFITAESRITVLKRIAGTIGRAEQRDAVDSVGLALEYEPSDRHETSRRLLIVTVALTSMIGAAVSLIPTASKSASAFLLALAASALFVTVAAVFLRLRETQEEERPVSSVQRAAALERDVADLLRKAGAKPVSTEGDPGVDFLAEVGGRCIAVEVKAWSTSTPRNATRIAISRALKAGKALGADELLVVTNETPMWAEQLEDDDTVRIMSKRDLRRYLTSLKTRAS
jgi:hypothetical protein